MPAAHCDPGWSDDSWSRFSGSSCVPSAPFGHALLLSWASVCRSDFKIPPFRVWNRLRRRGSGPLQAKALGPLHSDHCSILGTPELHDRGSVPELSLSHACGHGEDVLPKSGSCSRQSLHVGRLLSFAHVLFHTADCRGARRFSLAAPALSRTG